MLMQLSHHEPCYTSLLPSRVVMTHACKRVSITRDTSGGRHLGQLAWRDVLVQLTVYDHDRSIAGNVWNLEFRN